MQEENSMNSTFFFNVIGGNSLIVRVNQNKKNYFKSNIIV